jgi:signal transduction histidine kinase/putative methionine-R-sulfoxide reductase with GAF domain
MPLKKKLRLTTAAGNLLEMATPVMIFLYQLIVLVSFALIPILANSWLKRPFIGAFFEHTLVMNKVAAARPSGWELKHKGLPPDLRLIAIQGERVTTPLQLNGWISKHQIGETATLTLEAIDGTQIEQQVTLREFPIADRVTSFLLPYLVGLVYIGSSIWMFSARRGDAHGRAFTIFTAALGLGIAGLFDTYTTNLLTPLWAISCAYASGALINLALVFPEETPVLIRFPVIRWICYIPAIVWIGYAIPTLYNTQNPWAYLEVWRWGYYLGGFSAVFFLGQTLYCRYRSISPIIREQARLTLWGSLIAFGPLIIWLVLTTLQPVLEFSFILLLPLAIFPLVIAYAILRYRLLNTDYLLNKATLYTVLSILAASGYALLVSGLSLVFGSSIPAGHPFIIGLMVFILALLLLPLRARLQQIIDQLFFRGVTRYQEQSQTFGRELTQTTDLDTILRLLRTYIEQALHPAQLHIYIRDPQSGQYASTPDEKGASTTDVRFPGTSVLVQALTQRRSAMFLGGSDTLPTLLQTERARLALLGVQLFVPLPGQLRLVGWTGLSTRLSGDPYTNNDLRYLEALCDQAALALERAQVIANLERRVHEMDVLTRIAQGINITLAFDDILELIYAQTNLLIPMRDMRIALRSNLTGELYYAFYLDNDERIRDHENMPLAEGRTLEEVVITNRRPILTDDFERECHSRGVLAHELEIFAWICVPLNAGADTIGAISLGSRDPTQFYTEGQLNVLQAIADQAAGAIVKTRLLQERERRARQLATLNEIGKSLSSTLELKPLLNQILVSAAEILNCEAGSLFMLDEHTGEMIFEVTVGPVAAELIGVRLPPGTGLVGKAVDTAEPVIANDVRQTQGWSDSTDKQTGFVTRDLMVVPMKAHDRVIGVIEIINKRDGSPFNRDDQELLATFASQAAVAVENARLYTQTDEALTARVEELSVMQRIDRELNASLDLDRSMRITLEWAMRQSHAEAGFIGLLESEDGQAEKLRVIAYQGYENDPGSSGEGSSSPANSNQLSTSTPVLQEALETGQPQKKVIDSIAVQQPAQDPVPSLVEPKTGAKNQVAIPIRRTTDIIGALLMETRQPDAFPIETIAFLSRLSDHAAIAISNAQLFEDLQAANIAKSDFVSLVSHELKTPMTSIRGYTDLLAQGVVGPVNEVQANFLNTIRSNVNRMATLVSDLADVSRIEAGRMRLEFSAVKLSDLIQEVTRSQQAQIDEKQQILYVELPLEMPRVWGDQNRITQVLANLLSNASKYTPQEGKITIHVERATGQTDEKGSTDVVCVSVKDSGYGIGPKDQEKIFQKFFRSDDQNIRESPGTGLGLNITRHLVEMQGGSIWFESELGKGTTFYFTIPIAAPT